MSNNLLVLAGRILLALIFIISGYGKLTGLSGTAGYFGSIGLPLPMVTAVLVGVLELFGGLAVAVGYQTRIAAILLALFTVGSGFVAHFDFADQMQSIQFMKNLSMTGGFLVLAGFGAGKLSIDGRKG
ncbi:DoxX family protein [Nitratireductor luteus]|uniref:DoxX family protein n=1 Tax=Nitratireductor luteus TaxID=2976980 RepID=UPI00223FEFC3|nr:DoxX family protein [Nitratireductor luteus]